MATINKDRNKSITCSIRGANFGCAVNKILNKLRMSLLVGIFILIFMSGVVSACDYYCSSCDDCKTQMNDAPAGKIICLTQNITTPPSTTECIYHPTNFNNKIFDCQGYKITCRGGRSGIYLDGNTGNTIKNCVITECSSGIHLSWSSTSNTLIDNMLISNSEGGIHLRDGSDNNNVVNNILNENNWGIGLANVTHNNIVNNIINSNDEGILLEISFNNTIFNNTMTQNTEGILAVRSSSNNNIINNTINSNGYGIYLCDNSSYNNISGNKILNNYESGVNIYNCTSNNLIKNKISSNKIGIYSQDSVSIINSNIVCNKNSDFNSSDWLSSSGDNNTCDLSNGWNDINNTGCSVSCQIYCFDYDGDGYNGVTTDCPRGQDCNDYNPLINPNATESPCNGIDENCDGIDGETTEVWNKTFGGNGTDALFSIQKTTDGGYIIAGTTNSYSADGNNDIYLVKLNASGDKIWEKTIDVMDNTCNDVYFSSVIQTSDEEYIIAGQTFKITSDCNGSSRSGSDYRYWVKTNSSGDKVWIKTSKCESGVCYGSFPENVVQQTTDGYIILTGTGDNYIYIYLIKTDASGNQQSTKALHQNENVKEIGYSLQQTSDGGYIITGRKYINRRCVYLVKMDSSLNEQWSKTFCTGSGDSEGRSVRQTSDGGYIIAGYKEGSGDNYGDIYLLKTDSSGNTVWEKTFGRSNWDGGYSVQQTSDGGYIVTGYTNDGRNHIYLIKTDSSGNKLWEKISDNGGGRYVQETTNKNYVVVGGDGLVIEYSHCRHDCIDADNDTYFAYDSENCSMGSDCNDSNSNIHLKAVEICSNGIDEDCNGSDLQCGQCQDNDGDGYGVCPNCNTTNNCTYNGNDCDDTASGIHPDAREIYCNGVDENCDGIDECNCTDNDGDNFYAMALKCPMGNDCNDNDANIHPGADEIYCNRIDENCDGIDECYCADNDGDGSYPRTLKCLVGSDCDDNDKNRFPGAPEIICNGIDEDCDTKDRCNCIDADYDGYGVCPDCGTSHGCEYNGNDCDDNNINIHPGVNEIYCNGVDENCNGKDDCIKYDNDNDGYYGRTPIYPGGGDCNDNYASINPGADEICGDNVDNDCNGEVDKDEMCIANICTSDKSCSNGEECINGVCDCPHGEITVKGVTICDPVGVPTDTPCTAGWPAHLGDTIWSGNEYNSACDVFEANRTNQEYNLLSYAEKARDCCIAKVEGGSTSRCHKYLEKAVKDSGLIIQPIFYNVSDVNYNNLKRCIGLYEIYGNGPGKEYLQGYYQKEIDCGTPKYPRWGGCFEHHDAKYCACNISCYDGEHANTGYLYCQGVVGQPDGWANDTFLNFNSCTMSDLPAHASIDIISTGTCCDYSIALVTLLRMSGYKRNEIYGVDAPGHCYNVVKFPEDKKWTIVDTVNNGLSMSSTMGDWDWHWTIDGYGDVGHCDYELDDTIEGKWCPNDNGNGICPSPNEVHNCDVKEGRTNGNYRSGSFNSPLDNHICSNCAQSLTTTSKENIEVTRSVDESIYLGEIIAMNITIENKNNYPVDITIKEDVKGAEVYQNLFIPQGISGSGVRPPYISFNDTLSANGVKSFVYRIKPLGVGDYVHSSTEIYTSNASLYLDPQTTEIKCVSNGVCDGDTGENYITCPQDCWSGAEDGICNPITDEQCDLDCVNGSDPDCCKSSTIQLKTGWNLVSFPLIIENNAISEVLSSIDGKYERAIRFNDTSKQYENYQPSPFPAPANDFNTIENWRGYWISATEDCNLTVYCANPYVKNIDIVEDWNLIGPTLLGSRNISNALSSIDGKYERVLRFNSTSKQYENYQPPPFPVNANDFNTIESRLGYWISATDNTTLIL